MTNKELNQKIAAIIGDGNYVYIPDPEKQTFDAEFEDIQLDGWFTLEMLKQIVECLTITKT